MTEPTHSSLEKKEKEKFNIQLTWRKEPLDSSTEERFTKALAQLLFHKREERSELVPNEETE